MAKHPILYAAVGLVGVALVLQVVSVATSSWWTVVLGPIKMHQGLWKTCTTFPSDTCVDFGNDVDWLKACRAFGIVACILMAVAAVFGVFVVLRPNMAGNILVPPTLAFVGGCCSVICIAVYVAKTQSDRDNAGAHLGYSFALCVVAAVLAFLSGACLVVGRKYVDYNSA